ncbi:MAG: histidine kinase [Clostridiales bacterium]
MKQYYGIIIILWLCFTQITKINLDFYSIASILGAVCFFLIKEKYMNKIIISLIYLVLIIIICQYNNTFIILAGIPVLDFSFEKKYNIFILSLAVIVYFIYSFNDYNSLLIIILGALIGYILGIYNKKESSYISVLDEERKLRYKLEKTQNEFIKFQKDVEHLTEIRERNRIAREIHDNIGHNIAGILFQIQGAVKIFNKDKDKVYNVLKVCSENLIKTLELTRNTVYNIKENKKIGIESIQKIINEFRFCDIDFDYKGNLSIISSSKYLVVESNIKELLTNATKHSKAKYIKIEILITKNNIKLTYKDNGIGCEKVKENVGISGMKSRVLNENGIISIDGNNGFSVICYIPLK